MNKHAKELLLLKLFEWTVGQNAKAVLLQTFIQKEGPLSPDTAEKIRKILEEDAEAERTLRTLVRRAEASDEELEAYHRHLSQS